MEQNQESKSFQEKKDHMEKLLKGISVSEIPRKTPQSSPNAFIISKIISPKQVAKVASASAYRNVFTFDVKDAADGNNQPIKLKEKDNNSDKYIDKEKTKADPNLKQSPKTPAKAVEIIVDSTDRNVARREPVYQNVESVRSEKKETNLNLTDVKVDCNQQQESVSSIPPPLPPKQYIQDSSPIRPPDIIITTMKPDHQSSSNDNSSVSDQDNISDYEDVGGSVSPNYIAGSSQKNPDGSLSPIVTRRRQTNISKEVRQYDIDLLMIGKTGHGKSALGNSILGRNAFVSRSSSTSVTKTVADEVTTLNDRIIKVVDVPGVGDTDMDESEAENFVMDNLSYAISINPRGYHAILLVAKYGERFTKENRVTIEVLKRVFGENFISKYCILVLTHGDLLDPGATFEEWIKKQKGGLAELVKECGNRAVLFDNRTENEDKRASQRNELLDIVHGLIFENCRYTNEQFKLAKSTREALMVDAKKRGMEDKTMKEAGQILKELKSIQVNVDYKDNLSALEKLLSRAGELHKELECTDKCTGVMQDLLRHVISVRDAINAEIKLNQRIYEVIKNWDKKDKRKSKVFIKRMELQKQKLSKGLTKDKQRKGNLDNKVKENEIKSDKEGKRLNGKLDLKTEDVKTVSGKNMKENLILKTESNNVKLEGIGIKGELDSENERVDVDSDSLFSDDEIKDCDEKIKRQLNKTKELDSQLHEIEEKKNNFMINAIQSTVCAALKSLFKQGVKQGLKQINSDD